MCISGFWYRPNDIYRLILVSNRDELYSRLSMPAHWWATGILAGKDLQQGGTWLGLGRGRFAMLTNYRDASLLGDHHLSRGQLVSRFLESKENLDVFKEVLLKDAQKYKPFNLLFYEHRTKGLYYYSNVIDKLVTLDKGFYSLSNHLLNTSWPKTQRLEGLLKQIDLQKPSASKCFEILRDCQRAPIDALPNTGVEPALEHMLSSIFVQGQNYGTRFQSVLILEESGVFAFYERALIAEKNKWEHQTFQSDFNDLMIT